ncbi:unnamed protein product [Allacma fusca]|uniref:HMG box domain-containing protein n=1 Tax=Allacma fusca TaxID=39272 RepID=A0A8J2JX23_9HEXA|nr:unnamed protein product [Allacma fusca]
MASLHVNKCFSSPGACRGDASEVTFVKRGPRSELKVNMPKNSKPNGFMMYVFDRKRDLEKEGTKFANIQEAIEKIGPEWESIPKDERARYDQKAKVRRAATQEEEQVRRLEAVGAGWNDGEGASSGPSVLGGFPG